ncbi:zona pellucida sperm-binding protein 4-like [Amphiprion ocellaris]|nr:zona pellucida sperm-binding protein 4-like [Amphiprion ocellaris]
MAKFLGATSLVALALLGCLVGTEVEAQGSPWMTPYKKPLSQPPQNSQDPQGHFPPPQGLSPNYQTPNLPPPQQWNPPSHQHPNPPPPQQWNPPSPQYPNPPPPQQWNPPSPQYPNPPPPQQWNPPSPQHPNPPPPQQWNPPSPQHPNPPSYHRNPPYPQAPKPPHHQKGPQLPKDDQAPQSPQIPKQQQSVTPQKPHVSSPTKPQHPALRNCDVDLSVRIPCGPPIVTDTECESLNCCFEGNKCYFGKAVTVGCTKDGLFLVVAAKDATQPNIDLEAISLLGGGQGCTHVDSNSQFAIYQFPVTACGSLVKEEPGVIIYENRLTSAYEVGVGPRGAITRDSQYDLLFQCRYIGTSVETLVVEVLPLQNPPLPVAAQGPISVQLRLANGQCSSKGCNEVDVAYSSFYSEADYPVRKVLRDPVYVDVQLLGKTDPLLVLTLGRCWATTSPEPHSLPQWDILIDGCPYRDDRYLSSLVGVDESSGLEFPNYHKRFIFKMFTFVNPSSMEPLRELVYIHCSTAVCYADSVTRCQRACLYRRRRDTAAVSQEKSEPKVVVSSGPVAMVSPQQ